MTYHQYPSTKAEFFESQAEYFRGVAKMRRLTACVHLEGETDKFFWEKVFKKNYPEGKFFFLSYSKSMDRRRISGVEHCLKYVPYLSKDFFICIDSDYRYLTEARGISVDNLIFQTYTYSIENHYCFAKYLNDVVEISSGTENDIFDFERFMVSYSEILYELFVWHIFLLRRGLPGITKLKFNETLSNFPRISLHDNGFVMLSNLEERVSIKLRKLREMYPDIDITLHYQYFNSFGLNPQNTYLFVRGHNIYDFVIQLGKMCGRVLRDRKKEALQDQQEIDDFYNSIPSFEQTLIESLPLGGYRQMDKIARDIRIFRETYPSKKR